MSDPFLPSVYDPLLVILSMAVSVVASYTALDVGARIWQARGASRAAWIAAAATAMGGGIWSMHFIAMLAFSLPMEIRYDFGLTIASLLIAILASGIGFALVDRKSGPARLGLSGLLTGLGVAGMHYTGMAALVLPARLTYETVPLLLSVGIAIVAATTALAIATRVSRPIWRAGAAIVMGAAVCGMHYTGMAAACFTASGSFIPTGATPFERGTLAAMIAAGTLVILTLELASATIDRRFSTFRRWEAETARLNAQRFSNLARVASDLILVLDRSGHVLTTPISGRKGRWASDDVPRHVAEFFAQPDAERISASLAVVRPDAPARLGVLRELDPHGEGKVRIYDASLTDLGDEPSVGGIVLTLHDVTDRERHARELASARDVAETASQVKSRFIATMGHELRTPLNSILGFSEILCGDAVSPEEMREYAGTIHRSGQRLQEILTDVMNLSRLQAGDLPLLAEPVDAGRLLLDTARRFGPAAGDAGLILRTEIPEGTPPLNGDERWLRRIMDALLSNAVKFTPRGGTVTLILDRPKTGPAGFATLRVRDTGPGIASDVIDRAMHPFVQLDARASREHDGCGLGLALAEGLARLHGGRLTLSCPPGEGTTAILRLPLAMRDGAGTPPATGKTGTAAAGLEGTALEDRAAAG